MVTLGPVLTCDSVMLGPATKPKAVDEAVFTVPEVAPPMVVAIVVSTLAVVGPMIWMLLAPVVIVMLLPPEITMVPVEVARFEPWMTLPPPPVGLGPMMVIEGLVESCESVIFDPATNTNAEDEAVFAAPEVAPPAVTAPIDTSVE